MIEIELPEDFWLTSDTFFGRNEILTIGNRDFKSVEVMNEELIKRWNKKVKKKDTIIHLGNFAWDPISAANALDRLNGKIYFLGGNCDLALDDVIESYPNANVLPYEIIDIELSEYKYDLVLCHYPLDVWNGKSVGTIHAHGHTVFSHKTDLNFMKRFNVCTDFWNYSPVKLSILKNILESYNL